MPAVSSLPLERPSAFFFPISETLPASRERQTPRLDMPWMTRDTNPYPPAEDSLPRLHRSGWSMGAAAFTGSAGRTVYQADGSNRENKLRVEAAMPVNRPQRQLGRSPRGRWRMT
jgi:hypothetical protein